MRIVIVLLLLLAMAIDACPHVAARFVTVSERYPTPPHQPRARRIGPSRSAFIRLYPSLETDPDSTGSGHGLVHENHNIIHHAVARGP
jgi:hypothetical protein